MYKKNYFFTILFIYFLLSSTNILTFDKILNNTKSFIGNNIFNYNDFKTKNIKLFFSQPNKMLPTIKANKFKTLFYSYAVFSIIHTEIIAIDVTLEQIKRKNIPKALVYFFIFPPCNLIICTFFNYGSPDCIETETFSNHKYCSHPTKIYLRNLYSFLTNIGKNI